MTRFPKIFTPISVPFFEGGGRLLEGALILKKLLLGWAFIRGGAYLGKYGTTISPFPYLSHCHLPDDVNSITMKENQIQIDPSGVWIKTHRSKVQLWRSLITETLKYHGFQLLHSTPFKDSYYELSSDHHVHQFDSFEQLSVNVFGNGHIRINVRNIDRFFELIIPHLERTLDVKFQWVPGKIILSCFYLF